MHNYVSSLEDNVNSYKAERTKLVDVIDNKNTELNFMESKMKLFGAN